MLPLPALPLLLACAAPSPEAVLVYVDPDDEALAALESFVEHVGDERLKVEATGEEAGDRRAEGVLSVRIEDAGEDASEAGEGAGERYLLRESRGVYEIEASGTLGKQYGLAHLLELLGWRFPHPFRAAKPAVLPRELDNEHEAFLTLHEPEQSLRGLHLHTLHPIEGLFGFWEADPEPAEEGPGPRVEAIVDWVVKNRGNHLQWVALDDIEQDGPTYEAWLARDQAAVEYAHGRGLSVGLGVQLFGSGNLQRAYDLVDDAEDEEGYAESMKARWDRVTAAGFDSYSLSFGEFFGEEPERFLAALELARSTLAESDPEASMAAVVHVGDSEDQRVEYEGESILYYMLATKSGADLTPHIHTVMYYNLFDDAGGAYHHEDFAEHRAALQDRLRQGLPVAYFPESSYWVAFDNPLPLYLPLYARSRHRDLAMVRQQAREGGYPDLEQHILFSSGWEWGYWQNDAFTLRMGYGLPEEWGALPRDWFSYAGADGLRLAEAIVALGEAQHQGLIEARLAAYLAGRDAAMDLGFQQGIVAAPDRVEFSELAAADAATRTAFAEQVLAPLATLEQATAAALESIEELPLLRRDPFAREVRDGIEIDLLRLRFVGALYQAVLDEDPTASLALADEQLLLARPVIARRHADLHDPLGPSLIAEELPNATIYDYGYLARAQQLCFWNRERVQVARLLEGGTDPVPSCF